MSNKKMDDSFLQPLKYRPDLNPRTGFKKELRSKLFLQEQKNKVEKKHHLHLLPITLTTVLVIICSISIGIMANMEQNDTPHDNALSIPETQKEDNNTKSEEWKVSPTFKVNNMTFHGVKGKFGIIKLNGERDESAFQAGAKGGHYGVHFLDNEVDTVGKKYKLMATHKETGETIKLYEWEIVNGESGAKFGFDKKGLWKLNVYVGEKHYVSFVIDVK